MNNQDKFPLYPELLSHVLFWDLPIEERDVPMIHPITSNGQSMGFKDADGQIWYGILTEFGLRRKQFSHSPVSALSSKNLCTLN